MVGKPATQALKRLYHLWDILFCYTLNLAAKVLNNE